MRSRGSDRPTTSDDVTPAIKVNHLAKSFTPKSHAKTVAVDDLCLDVAPGELVVLLGPSGCGKTTTLRCVAGLETPDDGTICFGPDPVFDAKGRVNRPPQHRGIGMVFQSYALWPHLSVRANIAYPLKARRMREELKTLRRVEEVAELVGVEDLLDRHPGQLSGGQQQRVSLARGLVARPRVLLFDEPLSNLDARLRDQLRTEIHTLHSQLGFSGLYVTHDQEEALAIGDRLAVMRAGRIEQIGTPDQIFGRPHSEYVADFVGYTNRLPWDDLGLGAFARGRLPSHFHVSPAGADGVVVRARPEDLDIVDDSSDPRSLQIKGTVVDVTYAGRRRGVVVDVNGHHVRGLIDMTETGHMQEPERGSVVNVAVRHAVAFDGTAATSV